MHMTRQTALLYAMFAVLVAALPVTLLAQSAPATSTVNYPGGGAIQAGDASESFLLRFVPHSHR